MGCQKEICHKIWLINITQGPIIIDECPFPECNAILLLLLIALTNFPEIKTGGYDKENNTNF